MESTSRGGRVIPLADLEEFIHDHRPHGPLTGGGESAPPERAARVDETTADAAAGLASGRAVRARSSGVSIPPDLVAGGGLSLNQLIGG